MSRRNHTLHVRNISTRATYEDLKKEFERFGRVLDVTIPTNYYTREPKGYAFVEFEDHRDASEAAQELHEKSFMNHTLHIEFARGNRKTSDQMRSRDHRYSRYRPRQSSRSRSRSRSQSPRGSYPRHEVREKYDRYKSRYSHSNRYSRDRHSNERLPSRSRDVQSPPLDSD